MLGRYPCIGRFGQRWRSTRCRNYPGPDAAGSAWPRILWPRPSKTSWHHCRGRVRWRRTWCRDFADRRSSISWGGEVNTRPSNSARWPAELLSSIVCRNILGVKPRWTSWIWVFSSEGCVARKPSQHWYGVSYLITEISFVGGSDQL